RRLRRPRPRGQRPRTAAPGHRGRDGGAALAARVSLLAMAAPRRGALRPRGASVGRREREGRGPGGLRLRQAREWCDCTVVSVLTTGATLAACAEPLIEAGAERVMALVVARES